MVSICLLSKTQSHKEEQSDVTLSGSDRATLFDLPADEATLPRHYRLDDEDIEHIRTRRRPENQIGFAPSGIRVGCRRLAKSYRNPFPVSWPHNSD